MRLRELMMAAVVVLLAGGLWLVLSPREARVADPGGESVPSAVLIIGVDGLDWERVSALVSGGRMPALGRLMREGASGVLRSVPPFSSPTIWTSIATGKTAEKHGVGELGVYGCRGASSELAGSLSVRCMTLWEILESAGMASGVVGWLVTYPPAPVTSYTVTFRAIVGLSSETASRAATADLSGAVHPPTLLDEIAHVAIVPDGVAREDVMALLASPDHTAVAAVQARTAELARWLAADMTAIALTEELMATRPTDLTAVYIRGNDIVSHLFWRYAEPDSWTRGTLRPEFLETFSSTIDAYYERVDTMVAELLDAAREGTVVVVCSDHGFAGHRGHPSFDGDVAMGIDMHREEGTVILSGPGIARGRRIEEASVLDVAPTVLALLGLPVAADMDGAPIADAFEPSLLSARPIGSVDTYETGDRMVPGGAAESPVDDEIKELLKSLGYVN